MAEAVDPQGRSNVMYQNGGETVVDAAAAQTVVDVKPRRPAKPAAASEPVEEVSITQVSLSRGIAPRKKLHITARFRNNTSQPQDGLVVRCDMPMETTYVAGSTVLNGNSLTDEGGTVPLITGLPLGTLEGGQESELSFDCMVHPGLRDGSLLYHTLRLLRDDQTMASHTSCAMVRGAADLADAQACRLSAYPVGQIGPGEVITYTFAMSNVGTATASGITLHVTLPENVAYMPNSTRFEGIPLADVEGTSALFSSEGFYVGMLDPGQAHSASFRARVAWPLDNGTNLVCAGELRSHNSEPVSIPPVSHQVVSAPDFSDSAAQITPPGQAAPGDTLGFTILVRNSGNSHSYDTRLWANLPADVEYVPGSLRIDDDVTAFEEHVIGQLLSEDGYLLDTLEAPAERRVTLQGRVAWPLRNDTDLVLRSGITAGDLRHHLPEVKAKVKSSPRFVSLDSGLTVSPIGKVRPGQVLSYGIKYRNDGDAVASESVMRAGLPFEADAVPNSTRWNGRAVDDEDGTSVLFSVGGLSLGEVEAGSEGEVTFQATVATPLYSGTVIPSKAAVTCAELAPAVYTPVTVKVESAPDFTATESNRLELSTLDKEVAPGETIRVTLHFKNEGDSNADNVVLRANHPPHATPLADSTTLLMGGGAERVVADDQGLPAIFSASGMGVGQVGAGVAGKLSYSLKVDRPLADATVIAHTATIACDQAEALTLREVSARVASQPEFGDSECNRLTASPAGEVKPGSIITYSLDFRNHGGANATTATLRCLLSEHVVYVPNSASLDGKALLDFNSNSPLFAPEGLPLGEIAVDQSGHLSFQVRVKSPLDNGTHLDTSALINCVEIKEAVALKVTNSVTSSCDFGVAKHNHLQAQPADNISPNESITYSIRFKNTGDARAYRISLRANVPQGVAYVAGSTRLNGRVVPDVDEIGPLLTTNGLLVGGDDADREGEVSFQVKVHSPLDNGSRLEAQAFIALGERRGGAASEAPRRFATNRVSHRVSSAPDFSSPTGTFVEMSPSGPVRPGEVLSYSVHVRNSGTAHAQDVNVRAYVPQHTTLVAGSVRLLGQFVSADEVAKLFSDRGKGIGRVEAGTTRSITYQVKVDVPLDNHTVISNRARVSSPATKPFTTADAEMRVTSHADFSTDAGNRVLAATKTAQPGDAVTYTLYYRNAGDCNASGVVAQVKLPPGQLQYIPHLATVNGHPAATAGEEATLFIGDVAAASVGEASFTARVDGNVTDGTRLTVRVELHSPQSATVTLEAAPLEVSSPPAFSDPTFNYLDVYPLGSVACEEILTYTLVYGNRTGNPANDSVLRCDVPEHTEYVPGTTFLNGEPVDDLASGVNAIFGKRGLQLGTVEPRVTGELVYQVRVKKGLANDTVISNSAAIHTGEKDPFITNTTRNSVNSLIDFSGPEGAHLDVQPATNVAPGEVLTYTFSYRNRGNAAATSVALHGRLPENSTYVPRSTKLNGIPVQDVGVGTAAQLSPIFTEAGLTLPEVVAGGAGRVSYRVAVASPLNAGTLIASQLTLTCAQVPPVHSNGVISTVLSYPCFRAGDGTFLRSHPPRHVLPGHVVTFVLYYQNVGSMHAKDLRVHGLLPDGTAYVPNSTRMEGVLVDDVDGSSPIFDKEGLSVGRVDAGANGDVSLQVRVSENTAEGAEVDLELELTTLPATSPLPLSGTLSVTLREAAVAEPEKHAAVTTAAIAVAAAAVVADIAKAEQPAAAAPAPPAAEEERPLPSAEAAPPPEEEPPQPTAHMLPPTQEELPPLETPHAAAEEVPPPTMEAPVEEELPPPIEEAPPEEELSPPTEEAPPEEVSLEAPQTAEEIAAEPPMPLTELEPAEELPPLPAMLSTELGTPDDLVAQVAREEEAEEEEDLEGQAAFHERLVMEAPGEERSTVAESLLGTVATEPTVPATLAPIPEMEATAADIEEAEEILEDDAPVDEEIVDEDEPLVDEEIVDEDEPLADEDEDLEVEDELEADEDLDYDEVDEDDADSVWEDVEPVSEEAWEDEVLAEEPWEHEEEVEPPPPPPTMAPPPPPQAPPVKAVEEEITSADSLEEEDGMGAEPHAEAPRVEPAPPQPAAAPPLAKPFPPVAEPQAEEEYDEDWEDDEPLLEGPASQEIMLEGPPSQDVMLEGAAAAPPPVMRREEPSPPPPPAVAVPSFTPPWAAAAPAPATAPMAVQPAQLPDPIQLAQVCYERGMAASRAGDFNRAVQDYSEALQLHPQDVQSLYNRGYAWLRTGRFREAIEDFNAGLRLRPGDANAYFNLGNAYGKAGQFDAALQVYSEAIKLNPTFAPAYANRGLTCLKLGDNDGAMRDFQDAIRLDPQIKAKLPDGPWKE